MIEGGMNFAEDRAEPPSADSSHRDKRCFESSDLFGGKKEILIRHRGQEYRLLITKAEKLILNK